MEVNLSAQKVDLSVEEAAYLRRILLEPYQYYATLVASSKAGDVTRTQYQFLRTLIGKLEAVK